MANTKKELEVLLADKEIYINNNKVVVKRISFMDSMRLTQKLSGIAIKIISNADVFSSAISKIMYKSDNPETDVIIRMNGVLEVINHLGEDGIDFIREIMLKTTTLTADEVEQIDLESGFDLVMIIYEVNKGFFTKLLNKLKTHLKVNEQTKKA